VKDTIEGPQPSIIAIIAISERQVSRRLRPISGFVRVGFRS